MSDLPLHVFLSSDARLSLRYKVRNRPADPTHSAFLAFDRPAPDRVRYVRESELFRRERESYAATVKFADASSPAEAIEYLRSVIAQRPL